MTTECADVGDWEGDAAVQLAEPWVFHAFKTAVCADVAGDVLLHTVTDAILGALSLPDIGR
jgi:hypothetical protein